MAIEGGDVKHSMSAADAGRKDTTHRRSILAFAPVVLSLAIFASTVFGLPHLRIASSCCELPGAAVAVSNILYGAPLGSHYSGVLDYLVQHIEEPLSQTLTALQASGAAPENPPGILRMTSRDGNGVGYPLLATAAFRIFGIHAWALQATMLLLMALSTVALLWRFPRPDVACIATLYFVALELMLFMMPVWQPSMRSQVWVGGVRYFSLVGVLPVIHILLALLDTRDAPGERRRRDLPLLALQTAILLLTTLARGSAMPLFGAIALVVLVLVWRQRHDPKRLAALTGRVATIALVVAGSLTAIALSVPREYFTEGRFAPAIWERVVQSVGVSPQWPFPGTAEMFDCTQYIPAGLQPGVGDDNGHCIWFDYAARHGIAVETSGDQILSGNYEIAMREAFFKIAARYPGEVAIAFLYYKPLRIVRVVSKSMSFNFAGDEARAYRPGEDLIPYPPWSEALLLAALAVMLVQFLAVAVPTTELRLVTGVTLTAALFTLPSYFAAWANPATAADLVLYTLLMFGLVAGATVSSLRPALRPRLAPLGH